MFRSSTGQDVQSTATAQPTDAQVAARLAAIRAWQAGAQLSAKAAERARLAAAQAGPLAQSAMNQVGPLADSAQMTARRGVHRARVWAVPQLERGAVVVQEDLAPKVSSALIATAARVNPEPVTQKKRRWPGIAAGVAVLAAAAVAAVVARSKWQAAQAAKSDTDPGEPVPPEAAEAREMADSQAEPNGRVRTP